MFVGGSLKQIMFIQAECFYWDISSLLVGCKYFFMKCKIHIGAYGGCRNSC